MNKNLKKVISAASALAVSATGFAAFAASYPDVPETASYNQAVKELSALNIVNGYDDGTFQPDRNVSRAEITKMIVTALGKSAVSAADAAAGKDTQFADVTANHWAAGFVAAGTSSAASNFINGYSDTAFGPEDNVTYAQAIKMLVAALGYTSFATNEGGWPSGYLKYGYSLGLTDGLSGISNDQQLNRGQVAQLIDNALKAPICVTSGYTTNIYGQQVPNVVVKNGQGDLDDVKDGYQDLLNFAHDSYLVYGRVNGTFKTGDADSDEVRFSVEKADNWEGYNVPRYNDVESIKAYKGQVTDADDYLFTYSQAIIQKDKNDEYTLISVTPYGASEVTTLNTSDFKSITSSSSSNGYYSLQMYKDAGQSKYDTYKLSDDVKLYINGKEATSTEAPSVIDFFEGQYVDGNQVGTITLIDSTEEGKSSTDGKYDYIMVSYYLDGVVDEVTINGTDATIFFDTADANLKSSVKFDFDDDDKDYTFKMNGEDITINDIQEGDVLSIAYDVVEGFSDSNTYNIIVSRDTVEGKVSSIYTDKESALDNEYTLDNGETYKVAYEDAASLESGSSYVLYLDAFGKIAKVDEAASSKKYALLENVYSASGGATYWAEIVAANGNKYSYEVKSADVQELANILMNKDQTSNYTFDLNDLNNKDLTQRAPMQDRVIEYTITSKSELKLKDVASVEATVDGEYKSSTSKVGSAKVTDSISTILDLSDYDDTKSQSYTAISTSDLKTGTTYKGYAFGKTGSDKIYQLVLITEGIGGYNVDNNWAVFVNNTTVANDGSDSDAVVAYVNGSAQTLIVEDDTITADLSEGDVFFYTKNSDGEIDDIRKVTSGSLMESASYQDFYQTALTRNFNIVDSTVANQFSNEDATGAFSRDDKYSDCYLLAGPIVDVNNGDVKIATSDYLGDTYVNIDKVKEYELADDVNVYVYDYSIKKAKDRISSSAKAAVRKSTFDRDSYSFEDGTKDDSLVNFTAQYNTITEESNSNYGTVNFAIAKVVDREITEILVIIPDTKTK
jgi:hypothetical protein